MNQEDSFKQPNRHTFRCLSKIPGLVHGVFTRHGGISQPPYATLNAALNDGDSKEAVGENLLRIKTSLGLEQMVASNQIHGDTIHVVEESSMSPAGSGLPVFLTPPGDALVTRLRGTGLLIKIADCQAIFLVDPFQKVIANIHSGWRGNAADFPAKVVRFLEDRFECKPEDLIATISPSLGPCCAEFQNFEKELPSSFRSFQVRPEYFDFWAISRWQLVSAGLRLENVEAAERCTVCEPKDFFSYRGEGTTGRMAAVVGWKGDSQE